MFTGIIQEIGTLNTIQIQGGTAIIQITAPKICADAALGDSICVNGVCLTVSTIEGNTFKADISSETLSRTAFHYAQSSEPVNLEPALRPTDRLGGHIVSGHVDGVGWIDTLEEQSQFSRLVVQFPANLGPFIAEKGSISVDGVSLTVAGLEGEYATIALVPFTIQNTVFKVKQAGAAVNLEVDILARYVERLLAFGEGKNGSGLTLEKLQQYGYTSEALVNHQG